MGSIVAVGVRWKWKEIQIEIGDREGWEAWVTCGKSEVYEMTIKIYY